MKNDLRLRSHGADSDSWNPWIAVGKDRKRGEAGIGVRRVPEDLHEACFEFRLTSVAGETRVNGMEGSSTHQVIPDLATAYQDAFGALIRIMAPNQRVRFVHSLREQPSGAPRYGVAVQGVSVASDIDSAIHDAQRLQGNLAAVLSVGAQAFGFAAQKLPANPKPSSHRHQVVLKSAAIAVTARKRSASPFGVQVSERPVLQLPFPPMEHRPFLSSIVPLLSNSRNHADVHITLRGRRLSAKDGEAIALALEALFEADAQGVELVNVGGGPATLAESDREGLYKRLSAWRKQPLGANLRVSIHADAPVPAAFAEVLGAELLQGRPFCIVDATSDEQPAAEGDLSGFISCTEPMPPVLPHPEGLESQGIPRHFNSVRFRGPDVGIILGDVPMPFQDQEVRFSPRDRDRHGYVIGGTGTGKSTLLGNMIRQDIDAGEGVALLDPHGDLFEEVLATIPRERHADVVLVDFTNFATSVGLNLLECRSANRDLERGFITNELLQIFRKLYAKIPESMGPSFEQYFRYGVQLLMQDPAGDVTLADIPRVFTDEHYRRYLLRHCRDESVNAFWVEVAEKLTGEWSLEGFAAYVTNKLTEFIQNPLVRAVVGQSKSTIDFRAIIDHKKILLVNLSKGLLSERDAQFLGMIISSRLLTAALSRADTPMSARVPFHLYIDEFQNFTTGSAAAILAEARKYGLRLVLAHQNLSQVPKEILDVIHANTGTKIMMRSGGPDAQELAQYVAPQFGADDLVMLPDGHALVRMQVNTSPSPCFAMRTRPRDPSTQHEDNATIAQLRAQSSARHGVPRDDVDLQIRWRRYAYLENTDHLSDLLGYKFVSYLRERDIHCIRQLLATLPQRMAEYTTKGTLTPPDRRVMKKLQAMARIEQEQVRLRQGSLPLAEASEVVTS